MVVADPSGMLGVSNTPLLVTSVGIERLDNGGITLLSGAMREGGYGRD